MDINRFKKWTTIALSSLTVVIGGYEGYSNIAYKDSANVPTICYGHTANVQMGMILNKSDCDRLLKEDITKYSETLMILPSSLSDSVLLGTTDFIYNIGVQAFNSSSVKRELISGNLKGAGEAVLKWKYITVGSKKVDCSQSKLCTGLWKRRQWESKAISGKYKTLEDAVEAAQFVVNK